MARDYGVAPAGYRLPDETRLGPVKLQVADLARSVAYYEGVIGLQLLDRGAAAARLGAHGGQSVLVELHERPGATPAPRRGLLGLYHFAILVPNRAVLGRFLRHLAALGVRAGMADHLVSEALYLTDPDGLGIEVYADRPRETWKKADRQLAMAADPLDAEDLLAAGGDAPFTGLPAGTVIGHVHLHVGDIERASHFYHEGLGFEKMVWSYPGALFLAAGGYHHHLGTNTWAAGQRSAGDGDARLLEWAVQLPTVADATAALANIESAGYPVDRDATGGTVGDPWGTKVRVTALPRISTDKKER
jgi:catechol 2,3-dioxygenase